VIRNRAAYRTPDEVFYDPDLRMPIRKPDAAFAFLFFDLVNGGRIVGRNGIRHEGRLYRLSSLDKHLEYFGQRVDVRINPDEPQAAMIFDHRTGAYVCDARADEQDATYNTRDDITGNLIARVFRDDKELTRLAKAHVEGAAERLAEYRAARIEYLKQRSREARQDRDKKKAALAERSEPVPVISPMSVVAREREHNAHGDMTPDTLSAILRAEEAQSPPQLCAASTRPARAKKRRSAAGRTRHDGALRYSDIAQRLGISRRSLVRYRSGAMPWPDGLKERFDAFESMRETLPYDAQVDALLADACPVSRPRRTRCDGEMSYQNIAARLGMSLKALQRCRRGERPWPGGIRERFEEMVHQRNRGNR
jgi:hypothetical protein